MTTGAPTRKPQADVSHDEIPIVIDGSEYVPAEDPRVCPFCHGTYRMIVEREPSFEYVSMVALDHSMPPCPTFLDREEGCAEFLERVRLAGTMN